jgi:hypothetical protein
LEKQTALGATSLITQVKLSISLKGKAVMLPMFNMVLVWFSQKELVLFIFPKIVQVVIITSISTFIPNVKAL